MSEPAEPHDAREQLSPNGKWRVAYLQVDGEKSPLIVEPRITEVATGRVLIDMWRSSLDGSVHAFHELGFELTVRDPYGPTVVQASVDAAGHSFVIMGSAGGPRPLSELDAALSAMIGKARDGVRAQRRSSTPAPRRGSPLALALIALAVVLGLAGLGFCGGPSNAGRDQVRQP